MPAILGQGINKSKTAGGKFLRNLRFKLKLKQETLASMTGISQSAISSMELGEYRPTMSNMKKLSSALNCSLEKLLKFFPEKPVSKLGEIIRSERERFGLSKRDLAKTSGLSIPCIYYLESSKSIRLNYETAKKLIEVFHSDQSIFSEFLGRNFLGKNGNGSLLGDLIKRKRKSLCMTICDLAKKIGVSRQYIDQIEKGLILLRRNNHRIDQIAEALKIDVKELRQAKHQDYNLDENTLGGFLKAKRLERNLKIKDVSFLAKITPSTVSMIEKGEIYPYKKTLEKLSEFYGEIPGIFLKEA